MCGACSHGLGVVVRGEGVWMRRLLSFFVVIASKVVMFRTLDLITAEIVMITTCVWCLWLWPRGGYKRRCLNEKITVTFVVVAGMGVRI